MHQQTLCITGRLAAMSRTEALDRIISMGGTVVAIPDKATNLVIVGEGGGLLGEDGRLTKVLRQAHALQAQGASIEVVAESDWISVLGVSTSDTAARYAAPQLARMIGARPTDIRQWVRLGLLTPANTVGRLAFFGFRQLAHARALQELRAKGIPTARIVKSMQQLRRWLPEAADPTRLHSRGRAVTIKTERGDVLDARGQMYLNFDAPDSVRESAPRLTALRALPSRFEEGVQAEEEGRLEDACAAYERAIALEGPRAEICFNLGNVLHALGRPSEAATRFREAVGHETDYVEAWNNLGNVLDVLGETVEALRAFRHALAIEPLYADAHFNVAQVLADQGEHAQARTHWRTYLSLDAESEWAEEARRRLLE